MRETWENRWVLRWPKALSHRDHRASPSRPVINNTDSCYSISCLTMSRIKFRLVGFLGSSKRERSIRMRIPLLPWASVTIMNTPEIGKRIKRISIRVKEVLELLHVRGKTTREMSISASRKHLQEDSIDLCKGQTQTTSVLIKFSSQARS